MTDRARWPAVVGVTLCLTCLFAVGVETVNAQYGYPPQTGYPYSGGYEPQAGYPPQGYPPPGYPGVHPPATGSRPWGGYPPAAAYPPSSGYPPQPGYPPRYPQAPPRPGAYGQGLGAREEQPAAVPPQAPAGEAPVQVIVEPAPPAGGERVPQPRPPQAPPVAEQPPPAATAPVRPPASQTPSARHLATQVVGQTVHDAKGEEAALIHDLVINRKGQVTRVILSSGGFMGVGSRRASVPFTALQFAGGRVAYHPTNAKPLEQQPHFTYRQLLSGRDHRVSQLLHRQVSQRQGDEIGTIEDFVLGPEGQVIEAIVSVDTKRVAIPFQALRLTGAGQIVSEISRDALKQRPAFEQITQGEGP